MSRILSPRVFSAHRIAHVLCALGLSAVGVAACGEGRPGQFGGSNIVGFEQDASTDAAPCPLRCSLDGRSVLSSCSGEVVETCPAELACGGGRCQEPCAAAAADQSSNGCDFFLQPPRFTKVFDQGCYAAYVVNTSNAPVDVAVELEGARLDLSKALFTMVPGEATLVPHAGPLGVGEAAVVFLSDLDPSSPSQGTDGVSHCPEGVVPATYRDALPVGSGFGSAFHLETTAPVNLSAIYPFGGASSFAPTATLVLPVPSWGTEHMLVNAWSRFPRYLPGQAASWPGLQIVAAEDDTEITIRPTHAIEDGADFIGAPAKLPVTYRLSRGQVLQLLQAEELTGSTMTSTKPTSTFGGHECLNVPVSRGACDFAQQEIPAFMQWGSEYVAVGYRPRLGDDREPIPYRILAARDGTRLDYDPVVPLGAPIAMSAGEVVTFYGRIGEPFVVRSQDTDHPIYLAAYMTGGGSGTPNSWIYDPFSNWDFRGQGDPEYVNVVPAAQYLSSYSFFADPTYDETSLVIVRAKNGDKFEDVWLECAGNLPDFKPIGTRGQYEYTRVDLIRNGGPGQAFGSSVCKSGLQRMKSEGPFTATLWGWSWYASYAYPGGMAQRTLSEAPLAPVN